jgi:hypothetical protein
MTDRIEGHSHACIGNVSGTEGGTLAEIPAPVTKNSEIYNLDVRSGPARCGYVVAQDWRYGGADPFCNAPAVPGSSYCAKHLALCAVAPGTKAGARILADQAAAARSDGTPPEAAGRAPALTEPEPLDAEAGADLEGLDLPCRQESEP